jgi:hypothetical protein
MNDQTLKKIQRIKSGHRKLGVVVAFFLVLLAGSGILLNHSEDLDLVNKPVYRSVSSFLYGGDSVKDMEGWQIEQRWFYLANKQLYLESRQVGFCGEKLVGVVVSVDSFIALCDEVVMLLDPEGELIETTATGAGVPVGVTRIGLSGEEVILKTHEDSMLSLNTDLLEASGWQGDEKQVRWSSPVQLPERWSIPATAPEFHLERLILDIHSGRILGSWRKAFMDFVGALMVLLALGGIIMWRGGRS